MSTVVKDLGAATAYGYAVEKGYTGTEAEFAELMASYATVGQTAVTAAQTATTKASEAATSATTATNKATEATTAATTATTKAGEASTSASTATSAKDTAVSASQAATTKATEATTAAATATSAKTDAVAANTAAQSAKTAAQTAQTGAETAAASVSASAEQIATNAADISQLKSDLNTIVSDAVEESAFVNYGALTGSGINAANRWMVGDKIPTGTILKSVGLTIPSAYTSINEPLVIEVFEVSGGELTKVKEVQETIPTASAGQYVNISLDNYKANNPVYVSFSQTRTMVTYTSGGNAIKYIADKTSDTLSESALSTFNGHLNVDINIATPVLYRIGDPSPQILHIGEGYQYDQIQDALDAITDDSASKPYTLVIHPKAEPYTRFSTIRNLSESYPWTNAPIRYISMIGLDKYHCVIADDTGDYSAPPAEILVNGLIANLTFKATHTNQNATARQGAYAVHIDAEPVSNVGYEMQFENCSFQSDQTAGVGIGLHNASHLTFKNCEFINTGESSYNPHSGYTNLTYLGAFNCHSSTKTSDADQVLALENCTAISKESKSYTLATNADCYMLLKAFNNTFWCEATAQANGYKGSYCTVYGANHGNNAAALNA